MAANFHDLEVVHHAFNTLLTSLTPTQMSSFTEQLRAAPTPSPRTLTPASTPEMNGYGLPSPTSESPVPRDKRSARLKLKQERGKLRPLNAFMAFRSYYSPQLPGLTQKTKSGLIRTLWEQDQWKHFWTIAAKAYSELRDNHIGQITLEGFLKHTTGLLGVIPAGQYLNIMGWDLVTDTTGNVNLIKMNASAQKQNVPLTTNLSVRDIVEHCYEIGLVSRSARSARGNNRGNGMVMAFAAAPNSPSVGPNSTQSPSSDEEEANELVFAELTQRTQSGTVGGATASSRQIREPVDISAGIRNDYTPSIQTVTTDQQQTLEAFPSEYPYNMHFHPDIQQPALGFDPSMVQDDFDPFDISDYVNFDL